MLVKDRFKGRVLSMNCDLKLGSTRGSGVSRLALAISSISECPELGFVEGCCVPTCTPPKSSTVPPLDGGLGDDSLRFFEGCGLAARRRLAEDAPASWLGPLAVLVSVGFILRARFGEDENLDEGSFKAPKEEACDDLCRMTGGLLLLAPVLATTTGFLLPDR